LSKAAASAKIATAAAVWFNVCISLFLELQLGHIPSFFGRWIVGVLVKGEIETDEEESCSATAVPQVDTSET
jgi:hypothetical protein